MTKEHDHNEMLRGLLSRNSVLLLALLGIAIVFEVLTRSATNSFLSARSISTIFMQASVIGVLACGMTFLIILTHIDLSVGSALAFLGGVGAWMMAPRLEPMQSGISLSTAVPSGLGLPAILTFFLVLLLGLILWGLKGFLQVSTGMPAFIITLGGMMGYRGLAYLIVKREIPLADDNFVSKIGTEYLDVTIGWFIFAFLMVYAMIRTIKAIKDKSPGWYFSIIPIVLICMLILFLQMKHSGVREESRGIAFLTFIWAASAFIMSWIANNTVYGRHLYSVGGNMEAAVLCGIHVKRVTILAFLSMGVLASLASLMYLGQQGTAESSAGNLAELDAIAACVIGGVSLKGGKGSIMGAVLGTLIMQSLTSGLYQCNVESGYQMVIKAAVLIAVVASDHVLRKN